MWLSFWVLFCYIGDRMKNIDIDKIIEYGFILKDNNYVLKRDINDSLYAIFMIKKDDILINVYNKDDDTIYIPYNVKDAYGNYVANVRDRVDVIKNDILNKCFFKDEKIDSLFRIMKDRYNVVPEYLWKNDETTCVFRNEKKKWIGIYMKVSKSKLGIDSDEVVGIVNLKNNPDMIRNLIDNVNYFDAYHMNKKYWVSVLLDNNIDIKTLEKLIEDSYKLTE